MTTQTTTQVKANHRVDVIRIEEVFPHPNADRLEIIVVLGYQCVTGKGQFKAGDLAYYIPPDSVVPDRPEFSFVWGDETFEGGVPERKRRITVRKFRKEWSEGLLMGPINDRDCPIAINCIADPVRNDLVHPVSEGMNVAEILGITHWETEEDRSQGAGDGGKKHRRFPRTIQGWKSWFKSWLHGESRDGDIGLPVYDVEAFKHHAHTFRPGERVIVTEKIHGSNGRFVFREKSFLGLFKYSKFYAGSRNFWKAETSTCVWRRCVKENPWIAVWCLTHPGYALYGEVVPTQKGYDYGQKDGKPRFFLFDILTPNNQWMTREEIYKLNNLDFGRTRRMDDGSYLAHKYFVPSLYDGPFILEEIKKQVDGPSMVEGATTQREGIVIKAQPERPLANGRGRAQLKIVSNAFLERDSK